MDASEHRWWHRLLALGKIGVWLILAALLIYQVWGPDRITASRAQMLDGFQEQRHSRVIALIHRQDTVSFFGIPVSSQISIEDSEAVLRAIRLTPAEQPIDLILHTPGGLVLAAEQIAKALVEHKGRVTVFVPHYAMSGGTLIALAADQIVMDANAVLGPIDPQIGGLPAASIVKLLTIKPPRQISDQMLILADVAAKSRLQVAAFAAEILAKHYAKEKAAALAIALSEGRWTHDFPIMVEAARQFGLPVSTDMPRVVYDLMDLYPQPHANRPSVMYVPLRQEPMERARPSRSLPTLPTKEE